MEGMEASFSCNSINSPTWLFNNLLVINNANNANILKISSAKRSHQGKYECIGSAKDLAHKMMEFHAIGILYVRGNFDLT